MFPLRILTKSCMRCLLPDPITKFTQLITKNASKQLQRKEGRSAGRWAKCPRTCLFPSQNSWPYQKDEHKGETAHHADRNIY